MPREAHLPPTIALELPDPALVILVGISGAGKSTFAAQQFDRFEVVSSDECRGLVANDVNTQAANRAAFAVLHLIVQERLHNQLLTVVDATNLEPRARQPLRTLATAHNIPSVALVFDPGWEVCEQRWRTRTDRDFSLDVLRRQHAQFLAAKEAVSNEGFADVLTFESAAAIQKCRIVKP